MLRRCSAPAPLKAVLTGDYSRTFPIFMVAPEFLSDLLQLSPEPARIECGKLCLDLVCQMDAQL